MEHKPFWLRRVLGSYKISPYLGIHLSRIEMAGSHHKPATFSDHSKLPLIRPRCAPRTVDNQFTTSSTVLKRIYRLVEDFWLMSERFRFTPSRSGFATS